MGVFIEEEMTFMEMGFMVIARILVRVDFREVSMLRL